MIDTSQKFDIPNLCNSKELKNRFLTMEKFEGLRFTKMNASGNDFILINNFDRSLTREEGSFLAVRLCRRAISVGADGLILIEPPYSKGADFSWRFYNSDGSEAEMCGNGGRCAARFAFLEGLAEETLAFDTLAGLIRAKVFGKRIKIQLTEPKDLVLDLELDIRGKKFLVSFINTGVPHAVVFWDNLEEAPVESLGRALRYHKHFAPSGTNVNFVTKCGLGLKVRTYERGVEAETMACGTGAVASAIVAVLKGFVSTPVEIFTRGGEVLKVYFSLEENSARRVFLEGDTKLVYQAFLRAEALE